MLDANALHAAVEARDRRFDGAFFTGVVSTGIYCRCVCPARMPMRENRRFFQSAAAAEKGGFRPCLMCRPEKAPGSAPIDQVGRIAAQALARIEAGALEERGVEELAGELGVSGRHLRRVIIETYGASPIELAQTHRLLTAKRLLTETAMSVTAVAFASGFQSLRRFNALFLERYGFPPSRLRDRRRPRPVSGDMMLSLDLVARGTYDFGPALAFMGARAIGGVESVDEGAYRRTLRIGSHVGRLRIAAAPDGVTLAVSEGLAPALRRLVAAVRGALDLDADLGAIDAMLDRDPALAALGGQGLRVCGQLDPFECAVRAVLGQQVTIEAGRKLADRLTDLFGERLDDGEDLDRVFPTPAQISAAGPERIAALGMPRARAETLHRLAVAVEEGSLLLARGAISAGRTGLDRLAGFGPWTIEYIALRGLGDPDAFPAGDSALRGVLGMKAGEAARAEPWRPFRAYAATRLWRAHLAKEKMEPC